MKSYSTLKLIQFLSLFVFFQALYSGGFATGTLVTTKAGLIPIEQLSKQNTIIFPNHNLKTNAFSVSDISDYVIDTYLKIGISGDSVCVAPDQKFYLFDECIWIVAQELKPFDLLMDCNGNSICVESIENIYQSQKMHTLSIKENHAFCVSSCGLIAHNCEPVTTAAITTTVAVICPPALPFVAIGEAIIGGIIAGAGIYSIHRTSKKNKAEASFIEQNLTNFHSNSGNWHDPNDKDKNIFETIKLNADKKLRHKRFGNFYRDPKTKLWWSKDRGGHGGSIFKVFKEHAKGLEWFFDADELGNQIVAKHKGPIGLFIPYKELISCP